MTKYVCASIIDLADGSSVGQLLHKGTKEECDRVMSKLPAVAWNGKVPAVEARLIVVTEEEWEEIHLQQAR